MEHGIGEPRRVYPARLRRTGRAGRSVRRVGCCVRLRSHTGMAGMGAAGVFPAGAGRRSLRPAAVRSGQRAADTL